MIDLTPSERDRRKKIQLRNRVTLVVLVAAAVLFYALTLLRIG